MTGLEWNVRLSEARNPDAVAKIAAVFESYWASQDSVPYDPHEFRRRTAVVTSEHEPLLGPLEVVLRPFQEELLDELKLARHHGHRRNLLVSATGTGKTVIAAVDSTAPLQVVARPPFVRGTSRGDPRSESQHLSTGAARRVVR